MNQGEDLISQSELNEKQNQMFLLPIRLFNTQQCETSFEIFHNIQKHLKTLDIFSNLHQINIKKDYYSHDRIQDDFFSKKVQQNQDFNKVINEQNLKFFQFENDNVIKINNDIGPITMSLRQEQLSQKSKEQQLQNEFIYKILNDLQYIWQNQDKIVKNPDDDNKKNINIPTLQNTKFLHNYAQILKEQLAVRNYDQIEDIKNKINELSQKLVHLNYYKNVLIKKIKNSEQSSDKNECTGLLQIYQKDKELFENLKIDVQLKSSDYFLRWNFKYLNPQKKHNPQIKQIVEYDQLKLFTFSSIKSFQMKELQFGFFNDYKFIYHFKNSIIQQCLEIVQNQYSHSAKSQLTSFKENNVEMAVNIVQQEEIGQFKQEMIDDLQQQYNELKDNNEIQKNEIQEKINNINLFDLKLKNIEIYLELWFGFEMKIQFQSKYCKVYCEKNDEEILLYFNLKFPPKYFVSFSETAKCQNKLKRDTMNWHRVPNIFVQIMDNQKDFLIDETDRLNLINNQVIKCKFNLNKVDQNFKLFLENLQNLGILTTKDMLNPNENYKEESYQLFKDQSKNINEQYLNYMINKYLSNLDEKKQFEIKYIILTAISNNKILINDNIDFMFDQFFQKRKEIHDNFVIEVLQHLFFQLTNKEFNFPKISIQSLSEEKKQSQQILKNQFQKIFDDQLMNQELCVQSKSIYLPKNVELIQRLLLTPSGILYFLKEPEMSSELLRNFRKETKTKQIQFIRLRVQDDDGNCLHNMSHVSKPFLKEKLKNLKILNVQFEPFGYSASQLRTGGLWMMQSQEYKPMELYNQIGNFNKIKNVAKKAARMGQSFSSSISIQLSKCVQIIDEDDISVIRNGVQLDFSDGIGKISNNLLQMIKEQLKVNCNFQAIQFRMGGYKGVLTANDELPDNQIICRASQNKFEGFNKSSIQILDYNKYRGGFLNRQIIILLSTLGVPDQEFIEIYKEYLKQIHQEDFQEQGVLQTKLLIGETMGEQLYNEHCQFLVRDMIRAGIQSQSEVFLVEMLNNLKQKAFQLLRKKTNILVKDAARLMGILDEYKVLKENEVFISFQEEKDKAVKVVSGRVIVTRNPCLHPGDIQILQAVDNDKVVEKLGKYVNCVVFSQVGKFPMPFKMAGGDLDGDLYFVSWDKRLIPVKNFEAMNYSDSDEMNKIDNKLRNQRTEQLGNDDDLLFDQILDFYLDYIDDENLGKIANNHLAFADQLPDKALSNQCLTLAKMHGEAVDFAKSGLCPKLPTDLNVKIYPHFMEKQDIMKEYQSKSVIGVVFDSTLAILGNFNDVGLFEQKFNRNIPIDSDMVVPGWQEQLNLAYWLVLKYHEIVNHKIIDFYEIKNEFEIYTNNFIEYKKNENKQGDKFREQTQKNIILTMSNEKNYFKNIIDNIQQEKEGKKIIMNKEEKIKLFSCIYILSYLNYHHYADKESQKLYGQAWQNDYHAKFEQLNQKVKRRLIGMPWFILGDQMLLIKRSRRIAQSEQNSTIQTNSCFKELNESEDNII